MGMNKNKHPELVISFVGITGLARTVLSEHVQNELFKLGYFWSHRQHEHACSRTPEFLDKDSLCINSHTWNPRHITYANAPVQPWGLPQLLYNVSTNYNLFLERAKEARVIEVKQTIDGVNATITSDEVQLDASELLTRVGEKAREIQKNNFGR